MLRIMLPCAAARLLRRTVAVVEVSILVRVAYVFVVVVDVDVAIRPFASVTPVTTPCGAKRDTSTKG
jgi:hypothetical protein